MQLWSNLKLLSSLSLNENCIFFTGGVCANRIETLRSSCSLVDYYYTYHNLKTADLLGFGITCFSDKLLINI